MFGQNEIHGRKFFKGKADDLLVTSVFHTLQGEGPFAGRPAVFVRLTHCNLQCTFCDTNFSTGDWMTFEQLHRAIDDVVGDKDTKSMVLVITGGEPMLQQEALETFLVGASNRFDRLQIESNGLLLNHPLMSSVHLVVSPKCAQVDRVATKYLKPSDITLSRVNSLKFVVTADRLSPYHNIPKWALKWRDQYRRPVYVSPMAEYKEYNYPSASYLKADPSLKLRSRGEVTSFWQPGLLDTKKVQANHEYAGKLCLDLGLYLTMQMQLFTSQA